MKCKFPEKGCRDRFESEGVRPGKFCRLAEWKEKKGTCPYDPSIKSRAAQLRPRKPRIRLPKSQTTLLVISFLMLAMIGCQECPTGYINKTLIIPCGNTTFNLTIEGNISSYQYDWYCVNDTLNLTTTRDGIIKNAVFPN